MKKLDMVCPHDWNNCSECANVELCRAGLYKPDPSDHDILMKAAKMAEKVVTKDAIESAHKIRGTWMEELNRVTGTDEFWTWFTKYRIPDLHYKEPLPLDGPSAPGGGGTVRVKKSKKGTIPTVYVWGEDS